MLKRRRNRRLFREQPVRKFPKGRIPIGKKRFAQRDISPRKRHEFCRRMCRPKALHKIALPVQRPTGKRHKRLSFIKVVPPVFGRRHVRHSPRKRRPQNRLHYRHRPPKPQGLSQTPTFRFQRPPQGCARRLTHRHHPHHRSLRRRPPADQQSVFQNGIVRVVFRRTRHQGAHRMIGVTGTESR